MTIALPLQSINQMGRTTNEKCWACSLLTATEARKLHGEDGDSCWQDDICHSRRSYYRKGRGRSLPRKPAIDEVAVPLPEFPYVVLHTYLDKPRQPNDEVVIHAICAELWIGSTPKAITQPQHTFGLPPRLVREYALQLYPSVSLSITNPNIQRLPVKLPLLLPVIRRR